MRICSFLPSATEILFALGAGDKIPGVSDDCDYPAETSTIPVAVRGVFSDHEYSAVETVHVEKAYSQRGESTFIVDERLLRDLRPDIVFVQDQCKVCSLTGNTLMKTLGSLQESPRITSLNRSTIHDVLNSIVYVGRLVGEEKNAKRLVDGIKKRIVEISNAALTRSARPKALCIDGLYPLICAGHWIPEMVELAGGRDGLGNPGGPAFKLAWEQVSTYDPDIIILMPCSYDVNKTVRNIRCVTTAPGWGRLKAVKQDEVYAVDSKSYFSRAGPRLSTGLEILAKIMHPELNSQVPENSSWKLSGQIPRESHN